MVSRTRLAAILTAGLLLVASTASHAEEIIWSPGQAGSGALPFAEPKSGDPLAKAYGDGQALRRKRLEMERAIRDGVVGYVFRDCADCPEMVVVPAGSFEMGSNNGDYDEKPVHRVDIRYGFAVGKYEVTQAEYQAVMRNNPSHFKGDRNPVERVSWNDAKEFVRKLSSKTGKEYRLLSESEWEYVARASTRTKFWCGETENCLSSSAVYGGNSRNQTAPVGSKGANTFGLYDTAGNVWEWVEDCYVDSYRNAPTDGSAITTGSCSNRVLRGGSWSVNPGVLRSANRSRSVIGIRDVDLGFRVARSLPRTP